MDQDNRTEDVKKNSDIQLVKSIDQEALDVIFRLYDKTFKDLVER